MTGCAMPLLSSRSTFHHVGFVVPSIQEVAERFAESVGFDRWSGEIIHDPLQSVRVTFLRNDQSAALALELIEPAGHESPVGRFLQRGGGLHHLCQEVDNLEAQMELSWSLGGKIVKPPLPAVAFRGRRVVWVYTAERLLIEYLER